MKHNFYIPNVDKDLKAASDQSDHLCLVFKKEEAFQRATSKVPSYYMSEQQTNFGISRDREKETWGRELTIETPDDVNVEDIINRYGADVIMKCLLLKKNDGKPRIESSLKLNNLDIFQIRNVLKIHLSQITHMSIFHFIFFLGLSYLFFETSHTTFIPEGVVVI